MVIYEIGVGPLGTCRSRPYWEKAECVLFEPLISFYQEITKTTSKYPNVKVHNLAIYDYNGQCSFIESNQISHIKGIKSPYVQFGSSGGRTTSCRCATMDKYDPGNIDLLFLDMEGAEWFALKNLISRPKKIIVETQIPTYKNPYLNEITQWMKFNKYHATEKIGADTVWEKTHKVFM